MEFTEAESNMHDLVSPLGDSNANNRLLSTNSIKMLRSKKRRSMMKSRILKRQLRNEELWLCDTTWSGFSSLYPVLFYLTSNSQCLGESH